MCPNQPKRRILQHLLGDRSATSAVEFAILSPLFLIFVMGIIAYGIYFGASHSVQQNESDAARTAIAGLSETERRSLAIDYVNRNAGGYPFIDPHKLTIEVGDNTADGSQFVVSLRYDARDLPIWNLVAGLPMPNMTITTRTAIRIGGI
jgi:Flp pilus assembly protein TadG